MSRKRAHKFLPEDVVRAGKGKFRDKKTGCFVPKNWKVRVRARYYGSLNPNSRKRQHAIATMQYAYDLSEAQASKAYNQGIKNLALLVTGELDADEFEGVSDIAEAMGAFEGGQHY
jgi:hypothetical protein